MKPKLDIAKSWDKVSDSWQKRIRPLFLRDDLLWGPYGPWEKDAELISPVKGKRVLVAGCGSAPDVWWLAKHGAKVTGIDISAKQLEHAKARMRNSKLKAEFIRKDLDKLSRRQFKKGNFDLIISNYAFQYVRHLPKLFKILSFYLKSGGRLVFSLDHPVSTAIREKQVKREKKLYIDYLNERIQYWSFSDWNAATKKLMVAAYSYHRTMSSLYNALVQAGFFIEKILEPKPTMRGGIGSTRKYEKAKRIPETIIFVTKKYS